ncbi:chlorohydrolase [Streptococcus pneumoniae]|nr:hypothetical protein [Streptococcus pneumoniae]SND28386.1 chlorohydrolase [Streptococcus pneumoniae]
MKIKDQTRKLAAGSKHCFEVVDEGSKHCFEVADLRQGDVDAV